MRACILFVLLAGCGDDNQVNPDLTASGDLSVKVDQGMLRGCSTLVSCEANCGSAMPACNDACYDATSASGKALLQGLLDCLAASCTTMTVDSGGTACSTAEGTALQDPRNVGTTQLSATCVDCVQKALMSGGSCASQEAACLGDKS